MKKVLVMILVATSLIGTVATANTKDKVIKETKENKITQEVTVTTLKSIVDANIKAKVLYNNVLEDMGNYYNVSRVMFFPFVDSLLIDVLGVDITGKNNVAMSFDSGNLTVYYCDNFTSEATVWNTLKVADVVVDEAGKITSAKADHTSPIAITADMLKSKVAIYHAKLINDEDTHMVGSVSSGTTTASVATTVTVTPTMSMEIGGSDAYSTNGEIDRRIEFTTNIPFDFTIIAREPVNEYGLPVNVDKNFKGKLDNSTYRPFTDSTDGVLVIENAPKNSHKILIEPLSKSSLNLPVGKTTFGYDLVMSPHSAEKGGK